MQYKFHEDGTLPTDGSIFVFGSNMAGIHGAGAAKVAKQKFGAEPHVGEGLRGQSYAIPTKDGNIQTLPLGRIKKSVNYFLQVARNNEMRSYFVTRIGCGLAGYEDADIAPMFNGAPGNCSFAKQWEKFL